MRYLRKQMEISTDDKNTLLYFPFFCSNVILCINLFVQPCNLYTSLQLCRKQEGVINLLSEQKDIHYDCYVHHKSGALTGCLIKLKLEHPQRRFLSCTLHFITWRPLPIIYCNNLPSWWNSSYGHLQTHSQHPSSCHGCRCISKPWRSPPISYIQECNGSVWDTDTFQTHICSD